MNVVSRFRVLLIALALVSLSRGTSLAQSASLIPATNLIDPDALLKLLSPSNSKKPLLIQIGSHVLYQQAHIPRSEYIGPASSQSGLQQLRARVNSLPRNTFIVIYCGCCPWTHCPNVKPAYDALQAMGLSNLKVLYIPNNFGTDWVDKGYPTAKGD